MDHLLLEVEEKKQSAEREILNRRSSLEEVWLDVQYRENQLVAFVEEYELHQSRLHELEMQNESAEKDLDFALKSTESNIVTATEEHDRVDAEIQHKALQIKLLEEEAGLQRESNAALNEKLEQKKRILLEQQVNTEQFQHCIDESNMKREAIMKDNEAELLNHISLRCKLESLQHDDQEITEALEWCVVDMDQLKLSNANDETRIENLRVSECEIEDLCLQIQRDANKILEVRDLGAEDLELALRCRDKLVAEVELSKKNEESVEAALKLRNSNLHTELELLEQQLKMLQVQNLSEQAVVFDAAQELALSDVNAFLQQETIFVDQVEFKSVDDSLISHEAMFKQALATKKAEFQGMLEVKKSIKKSDEVLHANKLSKFPKLQQGEEVVQVQVIKNSVEDKMEIKFHSETDKVALRPVKIESTAKKLRKTDLIEQTHSTKGKISKEVKKIEKQLAPSINDPAQIQPEKKTSKLEVLKKSVPEGRKKLEPDPLKAAVLQSLKKVEPSVNTLSKNAPNLKRTFDEYDFPSTTKVEKDTLELKRSKASKSNIPALDLFTEEKPRQPTKSTKLKKPSSLVKGTFDPYTF